MNSLFGPTIRRKLCSAETPRQCIMTKPLAVGRVARDAPSIQHARKVLLNEGVLALPTDTVYGIAGLAQSVTAVRKLYSIKKRNSLNPVAICVGQVEDVYKWAQVTVPDDLLRSLLPGAVTLIFRRTAELNHELNSNTDLVGVRIPKSEFICTLTQVVGAPLALTSANISSKRSTLDVEEFSSLWPLLDLVIDGGTLCQGSDEQQRQGSTVIDLSQVGTFHVNRPGCCLNATKEVLFRHDLRER